MRRTFTILISIAFLLRGLAGDAMAVAMESDILSPPTQRMSGEVMQGCHDMGTQGKSAPMSHTHCQLCCAVIAIPSTHLLTFDQATFVAPAIVAATSFASNDLLPAFKPPIL